MLAEILLLIFVIWYINTYTTLLLQPKCKAIDFKTFYETKMCRKK